MESGDWEKAGSWRKTLADQLSLATLIALTAATLIGYLSSPTSERVATLTAYAFGPIVVLLAIERFLRPLGPRRRAMLAIAALSLAGVGGTVAVGMLAGSTGAMFLALILTALLFGQRAMLIVLALQAASVAVIAWLMVSGRLAPPLEMDVSFLLAKTWLRTGANSLVLLGLGAIAIAQVVRALERSVEQTRREAAERERAQLERTRALELALESQKVEVVGRLAAGLAHDLNNALFVIDACNQSMQRRALSDAERAETHTAIADAVKQSSSMARQLLSFARKHVVSPEPLSTRALIEEVSRSLSRLFPSDMQVVVRCDEDATVRADKVHALQALLNLAINSRDAMASGGELTLRAGVAALVAPVTAIKGEIPPGRYAVLEVRDNGSGMDEATRARAFEALFTTKPDGKGTGLGLASVLSTAEISGGYVTLWSEVGKGTRIALYLPIIESVQVRPRDVSRMEKVLDLRGMTVLLAEDATEVRHVISSALRQQGCSVLEAPDGTAALDRITAAQAPIDVLCTDGVMPGAPVRDVIARYLEKFPAAAVLVISGYVTDELTRRGIEQGRYRMLAKPFETQRLLETIAELRDQRRASPSSRA